MMQMINPYNPYDLALLFLLVLLVILGGILLLRLFRRKARFPWERKESLLPPAERSFLEALEKALGSNFRVLFRVPLVDLLKPRSRLGKGRALEAAEKIADIHLDFVVCRREDFAIAGVIELEGTRKNPDDTLKEKSLEAAGIPLVRFDRDSAPDPQKLRRALTEKGISQLEQETENAGSWQLGSPGSAPAADGEEEWSLGEESRLPAKEAAPLLSQSDRPPAPRCPACGAETVLRRVASGPRAGEIFRVCSRYPECSEARPAARKEG